MITHILYFDTKRSHPATNHSIIDTRQYGFASMSIAASDMPASMRVPAEKAASVAGLAQTASGVVFEYIDIDEANLLYEEIFERCVQSTPPSSSVSILFIFFVLLSIPLTRSSYLQHGIALQDGDTVLDIGANIGLFSLLVASSFKQCTIIAVEPIPQVTTHLRHHSHITTP